MLLLKSMLACDHNLVRIGSFLADRPGCRLNARAYFSAG
jgi:hypothetical protein